MYIYLSISYFYLYISLTIVHFVQVLQTKLTLHTQLTLGCIYHHLPHISFIYITIYLYPLTIVPLVQSTHILYSHEYFNHHQHDPQVSLSDIPFHFHYTGTQLTTLADRQPTGRCDIVLPDGSCVSLDPSPQRRLGHWSCTTNDDTYLTRVYGS